MHGRLACKSRQVCAAVAVTAGRKISKVNVWGECEARGVEPARASVNMCDKLGLHYPMGKGTQSGL